MTDASPSRSRKRFRWIRWAFGVCFVLAAASWLATPWYVRAKVLPDLWARYGLTMAAEPQDLSISGAPQTYMACASSTGAKRS